MSKEKVPYFLAFSDFIYGYEDEQSAKEWLQKNEENRKTERVGGINE